MKLTTKEEDYLETIYRLSRKSNAVGISDVARQRGVTLPTVISAVSRLKENGLVTQKHYGKIFLSDEGVKKAEHIYRTHKAIRQFLTEVLRLPAEKSEAEACKLEHAIEDETMKRLAAFVETFQGCPESETTCKQKYIKLFEGMEPESITDL
ncbi:MAG: metal-dependent transcriptional regulator [Candidatus Zixiibacteriota bacterium]